MKCLHLVFSLGFAICAGNVFAQTKEAPVASVLPVSPEAGSLGKFVDQPVSYYSGIPQINIPIYSIKKGDINVDVGLSYHAGGNKVDEIASRAGLGWSLNAGGAITRSARGLPDVVNSYFDYTAYTALTGLDRANYLVGVVDGSIDSEPDIYYVSAGNINVKIFKDNNNVWHTMPRDQKIKIQENVEGHDWIITDGMGVRYKFSNKEISESTINAGTSIGAYNSGISSWFLTQIEDAKGNVVDFLYENITYNFTTKNGETRIIPGLSGNGNCTASKTTVSVGVSTILGQRIKYINFSDGKLEFKYANTPRLDQNLDYALSSVEIHNKQNFIKAYRLFTSYFNNNSIGVNSPVVYMPVDAYRLKLDSLREETATTFLPPYRFTYYNNIGLPYNKANSQDHWGYFNGEDNYGTAISYVEGGLRKGAKKKANADFAKETILTKIQYPTGGAAEFTYEGNTYAAAEEIPGDEEVVQLLKSYGNNGYNYHTSDNLNHYFTETFTITSQQINNSPGGVIKLIISASTNGVEPNCGCAVNAELRQPDNSAISILTATEQIVYIDQAGTYTFNGHIVTEFENNPSVYYEVTINGVFPPPPNVVKNIGGPGLRIKNIKRTFSPNDILYTYFDYNEPATGLSSGKLGNLPDYGREYNVMAAADPNQWYPDYTCNYTMYSSGSNYQLINTKGGYIGYTHVTVTEDQNGNEGKKVFRFSYDKDINAETSFPYPPNSPQDWKRGLPLEESVYKKTTSGYELVQSKKMAYEILPQSLVMAQGVKVGVLTAHEYATGNTNRASGLSVTPYPIQTDVIALKVDTLITRENGIEVTKNNLYEYNSNNYKVSNIKSAQSDGSETEKKIYYPVDYLSNVGSSTLLSKMISRNLVDIPIEEVTISTLGGVSKLVSGTVYEYEVNALPGFDQFYLKKLYEAETQDVATGSRYNFLSIPPHYIERVHTVSVNAYGQPTYRILNGVQKVAYVWAYNNQYPIAEIKNADYATVETVLGGAGVVNPFTAQLNPSESSVIDFLAPLRTVPFSNDKLVTSFTYMPLVGTLRMTDTKGMNTYYEYDSFNRLNATRDYLGNIVKSYNYHYGGAVVYRNSVQSQNFTRNNCGSGYVGGSVTYIVPANTYSSTLSQADANTQALADISANGQAYANANATCTPQAVSTLVYDLPPFITFDISLYNLSTSQTYVYTIAGSDSIINIPEGTYDISITERSAGSPFGYNFYLGTSSTSGSSAVFNGVTLSGSISLYVQEI